MRCAESTTTEQFVSAALATKETHMRFAKNVSCMECLKVLPFAFIELCFSQLAARVMMSALNTWHAFAESAKIHADLRGVDRMPSALFATTGPNVTVCLDTGAIPMKSAASTSASLTLSAQPPKPAGMRSVLTLATVPSMPIALQETTEEFVHVTPGILVIHMASNVHRVRSNHVIFVA